MTEIPQSYGLKRKFAKRPEEFWCKDELAGLVDAPVYLFPDNKQFANFEIDHLGDDFCNAPLSLPHAATLFEPNFFVQFGDEKKINFIFNTVVFARDTGCSLECYLFLRNDHIGWVDTSCKCVFDDSGGYFQYNPRLGDFEVAVDICTDTFSRCLGLLSLSASHIETSEIPRTRRQKLERAGIKGWTYHIVTIDPARVRAAAQDQGGTHAAPRWHIRRGHYRNLADGRRVFVREAEVGDKDKGGVLKDYRVGGKPSEAEAR